MRARLRPVPPVLFACLLGAFLACDVQEPERYVRAPVIKDYSPSVSTLTASVGDSLFFSIAAVDPYDQDIVYRFQLADSVTSGDGEWTYVVDDTGVVGVQGSASNGASESVIQWKLTRVWPENLPPKIVGVDPPEPEVTIIVGDAIEFAITAIDPENKPLSYAYTIDDSIVGVTRQYTYRSTFVGVVGIRALVTDGESFVSHTWTLHVAAEPDSVSPAQVVVVSILPGARTGEVDIEWVAVGDDSMTGLPSYYIVRTSPVPIPDEHAWNSSSNRDGEPAPAPPGEIMRMTVPDLPPAQTVFIAVRAVDDFGLMSPLSDLATTHARGMEISGTVRDAVSGLPIDGVYVKLLSAADTTGTDGAFLLDDLPAGESFITFQDDRFRTEIGDYFDVTISPYTVRDNDVVEVWMLPNVKLESHVYADFLTFYKMMTDMSVYPQDLLDRCAIPCRVYVPALVGGAVDYKARIQNAFLEWEGVIGLHVFDFVASVPDTGLFVTYGDPERDLYFVTKRAANGLTIQGRVNFRTDYTAAEDSLLGVVALHEVGHALGMTHSIDQGHLMCSSPGAAHPTSDEVNLIRAMYRIPRGFPAVWLRQD